MSDSHPETLTDPEHSDQAGVASSPPQSGDEVKKERGERKSKLFNKENYRAGVQQGLDRLGQTIKTRQAERERDRKEKEMAHSYSSAYKVSEARNSQVRSSLDRTDNSDINNPSPAPSQQYTFISDNRKLLFNGPE